MSPQLFLPRLLTAVLVCAFAAAPALAERGHGSRHAPPPHHAHPPRHHAPGHGWHKGHRPPPPPPPRHYHRPPPPRSHGGFYYTPRTYTSTTYYVSPFYGVGFGVREREIVREYYAPRILRGECPSGLYFRSGACYPYGPRSWVIGEPVPSTVVIEPLPVELVHVLPPPPPRHRYARVAGDILLLAVGTNMVVDALDDLFD